MNFSMTLPARVRGASVLAVMLVLGAIAMTGPSGAAAAKLDPGFGQGGRVTPTYLPAFAYAGPGEPGPERVVEVADPKGGTLRIAEPELARRLELVHPDGSVDQSFGRDPASGNFYFLNGMRIEAILPLPSGKIFLAGRVSAAEESSREVAVAILSESGAPESLGKGGIIDLAKERSAKSEELLGLEPGPNEDALVVMNDEIAKEDGSPVRRGGSTVVAIGPDGNLDASFASGGIHTSADRVDAFEARPGGGLLLTGEHWVGGSLGPYLSARSSDVYLTRLSSSGDPDPSFGDAGTTVVDLGGIDVGTAVLTRPDGSIVVGGATTVSHLDCPYPRSLFCEETPALLGFTASGKLDLGFATNGVLRLDRLTFDGASVMAVGVRVLRNLSGDAVRAEGATMASRFAAEIDPEGRLDPGFGEGGIATVIHAHKSGAQLKALTTDAAGRIFALGETNAGGIGVAPAVFRFRPDGAVDRSFAEGRGFVRMPGHVDTLAADSHGGAYVLAGKYSHNTVTHVTPDGTLDPHYGTEGIAPLPEHQASVRHGRRVKLSVTPRRLVALPGGAVLVTAYLSTSQVELIRLTRDGALDRSFGHRGVAIVGVGTGGALNPRTLSVLGDGDLLLAGAVRGGERGARRQTAAVIRLHPDGHPDRAFGSGGVATVPLRGQAVITGDAIGPGGEIVVRGQRTAGRKFSLFVARFTAAGELDRSFLRHSAGIPKVRENAVEPPGIFFWAGHIALPVSFSPYLLVLSDDGHYERRLALGKERHPRTSIVAAATQGDSLVVGTSTKGDRTFSLTRLPG